MILLLQACSNCCWGGCVCRYCCCACCGVACLLFKQVSLLCPGSPSYLALPPAAGYVRGLAAQRDAGFSSSSNSSLMALATAKAGLQLVSMTSNNIVQRYAAAVPAWACAHCFCVLVRLYL